MQSLELPKSLRLSDGPRRQVHKKLKNLQTNNNNNIILNRILHENLSVQNYTVIIKVLLLTFNEKKNLKGQKSAGQ